MDILKKLSAKSWIALGPAQRAAEVSPDVDLVRPSKALRQPNIVLELGERKQVTEATAQQLGDPEHARVYQINHPNAKLIGSNQWGQYFFSETREEFQIEAKDLVILSKEALDQIKLGDQVKFDGDAREGKVLRIDYGNVPWEDPSACTRSKVRPAS